MTGDASPAGEPKVGAPSTVGRQNEMPSLSFRNLTLGYGHRPAVHHLDGCVGRGDLLAVVGPNGAGKSTLMKGIVGRADILAGSIDRHGQAVRDVAFLPQRAEIDQTFPINVLDFVATGTWRRLGAWGRAAAADNEAITRALSAVSLEGAERQPIGTLSGGQMQRALFARTIVQDSNLILLDEPFAAIDERTTADLLAIIVQWHREGRTVLAALHDLGQVRATFPLTLVLAREPIAWGPTEAVLTPSNMTRGRMLVESWSAAREVGGQAGSYGPPPPNADRAKRAWP